MLLAQARESDFYVGERKKQHNDLKSHTYKFTARLRNLKCNATHRDAVFWCNFANAIWTQNSWAETFSFDAFLCCLFYFVQGNSWVESQNANKKEIFVAMKKKLNEFLIMREKTWRFSQRVYIVKKNFLFWKWRHFLGKTHVESKKWRHIFWKLF